MRFGKRRRRGLRVSRRRSNPFKEQKGSVWRSFFWILNITIISALLYFVYFFFFSPYYRVDTVVVTGVQYVATEDVLSLAENHLDKYKFGFIDTENLWLYRLGSLRNAIENQYLFAKMDIRREEPNTIIIDIVEKNVVFRLVTEQSEYLVDDQGLVVQRVRQYKKRPSLLSLTSNDEEEESVKEELVTLDEDDRFSVIFLEGESESSIGEGVISSNDVSFIQELVRQNKTPNYELKLISLPNKHPEHINVITAEGWQVIFSVRSELSDQLEVLDLVIQEKIGRENTHKLDYVDLRLGKNVYFKYR